MLLVLINTNVSGGEGRLGEGDPHVMGLYHAPGRPESASSSSPPGAGAGPLHPGHHYLPFPTASGPGPSGMLVVPQPINASKVTNAHTFTFYVRLN